MHETLTRRRILRAAGASVALPILDSLLPRGARAAAPKRLVIWWQPDGDLDGKTYWFPSGGEKDFTLKAVSSVLTPIRNDCVFLRGVDNTTPSTGANAHTTLNPGLLTGGGPDSIDQILAASTNVTTPFKTLEMGVASNKNAVDGCRIVYKGKQAMHPDSDPRSVYAKLFMPGAAGAPADVVAANELLARRKSVLDGVLEDLAAVRRQVGATDVARLDAHTTAIRDLEMRLTELGKAQSAPAADRRCGQPAVDMSKIEGITKFHGNYDAPDLSGNCPNMDKIAAVQQQILVLALSCNVTQIVSLMYHRSNSGQTFDFLPITNKKTMSHGFAHTWNTSKSLEADFVQVYKWRAQMFLSLVEAMKKVTDVGGGTLLDNALVLWCSDMGTGGHDPRNVPFVLAGSAGGAIKTGRFLQFTGQSHARLLVAILAAFGVQKTLGTQGTSPLPGIV